MKKEAEQTCASCGNVIKGRAGKRFCDDVCRNAWHNTQNKEEANQIRPVNAILKKNRKVLIELNVTGKSKVHKDKMLSSGFKFDFITRMYTTKNGRNYYFCYEQGYLPLDNGWYMLVVDTYNKED